MAANKPLPLHLQFAAGAIAGVSEIVTMYPLDVVKTRFQLQVGRGEYSSIADCFRQIVQREGASRLYRGILAPILIEAPKRATKFAANEQYGELFKRLLDWQPSQKLSVATGVSAGITEAFLVVPFELVKIRMQDKHSAGRYSSTADAFRKVLSQEGLLGFYKGLEATLWRHAAWNGGYFGLIFYVKDRLPKAQSHEGVLFNNFVAGTIGGTFGTTLNTPFDVVKTRVQNQLPSALKYNWTLPAIVRIGQEEGFKALYKGYVPKVLRLGPGGGILLVVFSQVSAMMQQLL